MSAGPFKVTVRPACEPSSVVAVAALDDAREAVIQACPDEFPDARVFAKLAESIAAIGDNGGKVELPSGESIEVEATTLWELRGPWLSSERGSSAAEIIAAWNEKHAGEGVAR